MSKATDFHQLTIYVFPPGFKVPQTNDILSALSGSMFEPIDEPTFTELGFGVTAFDDFMWFNGMALANATLAEEYIAFGFRLDKRTVPAGAVERRFREKVDEWHGVQVDAMPKQGALPGTGAEPRPIGDPPKMSKALKKDLKDSARSELICKAPPNPKHIPVVLDMSKGRIYVGTTSAPILKAFEALMCETFRTFLIPLDPCQRLDLAGLKGAAENFTPGMSFLTWLWRRIVAHMDRDEPMELASQVSREPDQVRIQATSVYLEEGNNGSRDRFSAQGPNAASMEEVETAIRAGRSVTALGLTLTSFEDVYLIETTHMGLSFRALKLPKIPKEKGSEEDAHGEFVIRMGQVRDIIGYLDDLWLMWTAKLLEEGRLVRQTEERDAPVGYARVSRLAESNKGLFGDIHHSNLDISTMTFGAFEGDPKDDEPTEEAAA